jgi:hypothetical protein
MKIMNEYMKYILYLILLVMAVNFIFAEGVVPIEEDPFKDSSGNYISSQDSSDTYVNVDTEDIVPIESDPFKNEDGVLLDGINGSPAADVMPIEADPFKKKVNIKDETNIVPETESFSYFDKDSSIFLNYMPIIFGILLLILFVIYFLMGRGSKNE